MTTEMANAYDPPAVESAWDAWWEESGFYSTDVEKAKSAPPEEKFVMVIPPPNVTGALHIGHALTCSVEDALARWHRMQGHSVMWLPGTDHAGIATQAVVEKKLWRDEKKTRHDLGREKFLDRVWEWKNEKGNTILNQLRRLGASVDHSRSVFTLDEIRSQAVTHAFVTMFEMGIIYRKTRLVNWSHALNTAISDIEVDNEELKGKTWKTVKGHDPKKKYEFGTLTSFAYKIADEQGKATDEEIIVATTRLETMLGDTGVAIHPDDPRYKHLHGKFVVHPFNNRKIPIVLDSELVKMDFGSGAVKITPAHDPNDYACGERNNLEFISILNDDGTINKHGGKFEGLMRYDARVAVEECLKELNLYRDKVDNAMTIPICSRSGDIIEPRLKPQWWVDTNDMAAKAIESVDSGELKIIPEFHKSTWRRWLTDPHQWCISRQLWWGHRIPAYKVKLDNQETEEEVWVVGHTEEEARENASKKINVDKSSIMLEQDEDVLDTWFSSGLFPMSVFGWPKPNDDLDAFFPGSLLETGHDILFFWVARMVMMSQTLTGKLPFSTVYLHAIVRDRYGRKMSKSLGNIIDPISVIEGVTLQQLHDTLKNGNLPEKEVKKAIAGQKVDYPDGIPQCGADALRFGLLANITQGQDINLDINNVAANRRFCNKLWQVTRFCLGICGKDLEPIPDFLEKLKETSTAFPLATRDRWILSELAALVKSCDNGFRNYTFADVTYALSQFWTTKLCDVYVEAIKPIVYKKDPTTEDKAAIEMARNTLLICLDYGLKLMHPIMPFVTEELWQRLPGKSKESPKSIMIAPYPMPKDVEGLYSEDAVLAYTLATEVSQKMRSLKADYNVTGKEVKFFLAVDDARRDVIEGCKSDMNVLGGGLVNVLNSNEEPPKGCSMSIVDGHLNVHILLKGAIDAAAHIKKAEKSYAATEKLLASTTKKLNTPRFVENAPEAVLKETKAKAVDLQAKLEKLKEQVEEFKSLL